MQGLPIGRIQHAEGLLGRATTPVAELRERPLDELGKLADELDALLANRLRGEYSL